LQGGAGIPLLTLLRGTVPPSDPRRALAPPRIAQVLAQTDELNSVWDEEHGDDDGGGGLPEELLLREQRVAKLQDGIIVAAAATTSPRDVHQLVAMIDAVEHNTGEAPQRVLADNGYLSEDNLAQLRARGQRCLVATGRESRKPRRWPLGRETQRMHRILRLP
jgi:hypothetical protein